MKDSTKAGSIRRTNYDEGIGDFKNYITISSNRRPNAVEIFLFRNRVDIKFIFKLIISNRGRSKKHRFIVFRIEICKN